MIENLRYRFGDHCARIAECRGVMLLKQHMCRATHGHLPMGIHICGHRIHAGVVAADKLLRDERTAETSVGKRMSQNVKLFTAVDAVYFLTAFKQQVLIL